jgi:hypothetical protein
MSEDVTSNIGEQDYYKQWHAKLPQFPDNKPDLQQRSPWKFFNIGWIASIITIVSALISGLVAFFCSDVFVGTCVGFCISAVVVACFYCYQSIKYCNNFKESCKQMLDYFERQSGLRFLPVAYYLHFVNHIVRDYTAKLLTKDDNIPQLEQTIELFVDAVSECFSVITGHRCRCCVSEASIKNSVVEKNKRKQKKRISQKVIAKVICRDTKTRESTPQSNLQKEHILSDNTDFTQIWDKNEHVYVCGDIPKAYANQEYINSSIDKSKVKITNGEVVGWHLPYKSTLVVPIRSNFLFPTTKADDCYECWGFLCVDSNETNVFDNPCLVELAGSFADLFFQFLTISQKIENDNLNV